MLQEAIDKKNQGKIQRVIAAGCLVQRHRAKLLDWVPGIDAMIGVFDRDRITEALLPTPNEDLKNSPPYWIAGNALIAARERGMSTTGLTVEGKDGKGLGYFEDDGNRLRLTPRHWGYLRIGEGCNQRCAFCTIPSIRGKMRSKPSQQILEEARKLIASGVFELNLIGQDTTSYGMDIGCGDDQAGGLADLLEQLDGVVAKMGGGWIRLMYAYPTHFGPRLIEAMQSLEHVVPYVDMPLQHASNSILLAMRRNVTAVEQSELLQELREKIPSLALRTTFITGFPGETEEDHQELLEFIEEEQFEAMGVFRFSPEPGTVGARIHEDETKRVDSETMARREAELMLLQQEIAFENASRQAEHEIQLDVLVDSEVSKNDSPSLEIKGIEVKASHISRGYHQAPQVDSMTWLVAKEKIVPGELVRATVIGSSGYDLVAKPVSELKPNHSLPIASA